MSARWLFSRRVDLAVFGGSALLSLALLAVGAALGILHDDTPDWAWIACVVLVDVAHVWSTGFRVYLDPDELARRPWVYALVPACGWFLGVWAYGMGAGVFWRGLAYLAVFHFVRQQAGWVRLYRARAGETSRSVVWVDTAAIYAATLVPLLHWHTHLPRRFAWFLSGDFVDLPAWLMPAAWSLWGLSLGAYAITAVHRAVRGSGTPGKDLVVASTALLWALGIVVFNSDYAFTVTNVLIHGVPYFALVYAYGRARARTGAHGPLEIFLRGPLVFLLALVAVALVEELLWDRGVWHERAWLFGTGISLGGWERWVVPLLAVPQLTHYVLDGLVWRRASNPLLAGLWRTTEHPRSATARD